MNSQINILCSHCGENCPDDSIQLNELNFCCTGCKSVYSILNQHQLSNYYCLNEMPGHSMNETHTSKFQYLDDASIVSKLISFKNSQQTQIDFFIPQIHCSSCLWLLEHLYKLHEGIITSEVNFNEKKVRLSFDHNIISLKQVVELLSSVGYEPLITLQDYDEKEIKPDRRKGYVKLGLVGFCFANIMMISFPEYLGMSVKSDPLLSVFFRYANLVLALPVFFYGASDFFKTAWQGIKQRFLNIDVPISLAILITFVRSVYEVINQSGSGYFDSMSGIVFFMLIGRGLQQKTFNNLKFNRDFKSYFPIAVSLIQDKVEVSTKIQDVKEGDVLKVLRNEIIPVDCMLSSRMADIDYSFVTGENDIQSTAAGELIYAGGKVHSPQIDVICVKPFSQGHFTSLWNNQIFKTEENQKASFVEVISRYFSLVLMVIAALSFTYWYFVNPANSWNALTAVLIVACPCTLLLASSYTYGFMIELFAKEGMFVKNSQAIDSLNEINHIIFDKTGTISTVNQQEVKFVPASHHEKDLEVLLGIMKHSSHPLSERVCKFFSKIKTEDILHSKEIDGQGIEAWHHEQHIKIGSAKFVGVNEVHNESNSIVYYSFDHHREGYFMISNTIKEGVEEMIKHLKSYRLSLLSGDTAALQSQMQKIFPEESQLLFRQSPQQKLDFVQQKQKQGEKVLMIGDGINDAGALKQSDLGISVVENYFSFSPASDVILHADKVAVLDKFIFASKAAKRLIVGTFIYSLLYNVIGLSIAVSAHLKPVVAAILMPASSISVIFIAFLGTQFIFKKYFKYD